MKLISISEELVSKFTKADSEFLIKDHRPVALVVSLKFRESKQDFAVPLRSNISPSASREEYFPLPNRKNTKPHHHHGLHFIKMFPVASKYYIRYRTDGNIHATMCLAYMKKYEKDIVSACQNYLDRYCKGIVSQYSTNLDALIIELKRLNEKASG